MRLDRSGFDSRGVSVKGIPRYALSWIRAYAYKCAKNLGTHSAMRGRAFTLRAKGLKRKCSNLKIDVESVIRWSTVLVCSSSLGSLPCLGRRSHTIAGNSPD